MEQKGNTISHIKNMQISKKFSQEELKQMELHDGFNDEELVNKRILLHKNPEAEELLQNYLSALMSARLVSINEDPDYIDGYGRPLDHRGEPLEIYGDGLMSHEEAARLYK